MKIRVYDSDGEFRGGLFKTHVHTAMNCRLWHAPPHPHYRESLIDIAGLKEPCYDGSWFLLRLSRHPELSGPKDGDDEFDADSQAHRISLKEAMEWFRRFGFDPPPDLVMLAGARATATTGTTALDKRDPFAPYMPARWFKDEYGIHEDRLRSARRSGRIRAITRRRQVRYSVPGAQDEWPEEGIALPNSPVDRG